MRASIANYPLSHQFQDGFGIEKVRWPHKTHLFRHGVEAVHLAKSTKKRTSKTLLTLLDLEQSKSVGPEESHLAAGIRRVRRAKRFGVRVGSWGTKLRTRRNHAILAASSAAAYGKQKS